MPKHFSTLLLDSTLKRKKQESEKRRKSVLKAALLALDELSKTTCFENAYIFGSITKASQFSGRSDVDIGFIGLSDEDVIKTATFLSRTIGLDVDVIQLEDHKLAQKIKRGLEWKRTR